MLVTQAEFAKKVSVNRAYISNLIKKGSPRLVTIKETVEQTSRDGTKSLKEKTFIDLEQSLAAWVDYKKDHNELHAYKEFKEKNIKVDRFIDPLNKKIDRKQSKNNKTTEDLSVNIAALVRLAEEFEIKDLNKLEKMASVISKNFDIEVNRGEYISKKIVESIMPSLFISFVSRCKNMPLRVAAIMADRFAIIINDANGELISEEIIHAVIKDLLEKECNDIINFLNQEVNFNLDK